MPDAITLTLPRDPRFYGVAHLVVGGLAARLNLTLEHLEDLRIALDELFEHGTLEDATVRLTVDGSVLHARVGPFDEAQLHRELESETEVVGLRRLLDTVAAGYELVRDDGGQWVELSKRISS